MSNEAGKWGLVAHNLPDHPNMLEHGRLAVGQFKGSFEGSLTLSPVAFLHRTVVCLNSPRTDLNSAQEEAHMTTVGAVEGLLRKTGLRAQDIDILVTT